MSEPNIAKLIKSLDDRGANQITHEYNTINILDNAYKYEHHGLGYKVHNSATKRDHFITISSMYDF